MAEQPPGPGSTDQTSPSDSPEPNGSGNGAGPAKPAWTTGWQRLSRTFVGPPVPRSAPRGGPRSTSQATAPVPDFAGLTDAQKRQLVNQVDGMEKKIGYAASALAVVLTLVGSVPYMVRKVSVATLTKPSDHSCPHHYTYTGSGSSATCNTIYSVGHYAFYMVVLLVFAAAILVTVRIGRRAPLAFTIVLTGLALGSLLSQTIAVLPFIIAGGWLLLRAYRSQKYGAPGAKAPLPGYTPAARGPAPRAKAGSATNASRRSRKGAPPPTTVTGRAAPGANKRYTPKTPPKPTKPTKP